MQSLRRCYSTPLICDRSWLSLGRVQCLVVLPLSASSLGRRVSRAPWPSLPAKRRYTKVGPRREDRVARARQLPLQPSSGPAQVRWVSPRSVDMHELAWWKFDAASLCAGLQRHFGRRSTSTSRLAPRELCGNCGERGHFAADCPKQAPCFRCGKLGHWAKSCPEPRVCPPVCPSPSVNTETRWVIFEPPTLKTYRHFCSICGYETSVVTKASGGMPRHKSDGEWCPGSGCQPAHSELLSERRQRSGITEYALGAYDEILDWKVGRRDVVHKKWCW